MATNKAVLICANDIGTTRVKSLSTYFNQIKSPNRIEFESLLGEPHQILGEDFELRKIQTEDGEWFIGESARIYSSNLIWGRDPEWIFSPYYKALHLYAIYSHLAPSITKADIYLSTALPFADRKNSKELENILTGEHTIHTDREVCLNIKATSVGIQGLTALMSDAPKNGDTVVWLGLGGRNKTFATMDHGKILTTKTGSDEGGFLSVLEALGKSIRDEYYLELTETELVKVLSTNRLKVKAELINVSEMVQDVLYPYQDGIINSFIPNLWPISFFNRIDQFRLGGGGSLAIGEQIKNQYEQVILADNPRWTEAEGLIKMAIKKWGR